MATTSPKFSLQAMDFLKGLAVAALSQPLLIILTTIAAGHFTINWTEQWHLAVSSGAAYLIKNFFSGATPPTSGSSSVGTKASIIILLVCFGSVCHAQSIFKPLPPYKVPAKVNAFARIVGPTDSLPSLSTGKWDGVRFAGPDIVFAVPDFSMYTGIGLDYCWATADATTSKWNYAFTIGPRIYGGANLGVPTVKAIGAIGIRATFLNGWLAIGALYNLTTKKPQAAVGNPAALIPGLN